MGDSNHCGALAVTSWGPTKPLPKLPVPELAATLEKYLTLLTPVLTPKELETTRQNVEEILQQGGVGEVLQSYLLRRQAQLDNWVYDWWLDDMYLKLRVPLPINSNPGMVFPKQQFSSVQQQLSYAARFLCGMLDYKIMIDSGTIPVERLRYLEKGQPLCMEQHYRMFSSYRRPGIPKDVQLTTLGKDRPPYIIVACCGQFYKLGLTHEGAGLSGQEIYSQLSEIVAAAEIDFVGAPTVGVLTSRDRTKWASARAKLSEDAVNANNLDTIENSLFILCLDKQSKMTYVLPGLAEDDFNSVSQQMLHGQGASVNTCNRWFDKTIQIIVAEDGACGMNYEHSVAEGIALVQLVEHALTYLSKDDVVDRFHQQKERHLPDPLRLTWRMTSDTLAEIDQASDEIDTLIDDFDFHVLKFSGFGRDFPKNAGFSPDAFIQLALQLTYYKLHKRLVSTYESASLRRFRKGRVDNIRANSTAALSWIRAMLGEVDATIGEKFALFKTAAEWQQTYQTETVLGSGIDCHLLGLREAATDLGILHSVPFFSDPAFARAHHFALSTSQVPTSSDSYMCYGPVVPDGYGVCYNPFPTYIYFCVSSFYSCDDTDSGMFAHSIESSLLQMRELCLQGSSSTENS